MSKEENIYKIADLAKAEGVRAIPMAKKLLNRAIREARAAKFGARPTALAGSRRLADK